MKHIILDTGILGLICHPSKKPEIHAAREWLVEIRNTGVVVVIPEIADYELRRELIRINSAPSLSALDRLSSELLYAPLSTRIMRMAAELWADARKQGRMTAPDTALDGDVILCAQTISLSRDGEECVVATTNVRHLGWFVDAREWASIDPNAIG